MSTKFVTRKTIVASISLALVITFGWWLSSNGYLTLESIQQSLNFLETKYDNNPALFITAYVVIYAAVVALFIPGLVPLNLLAGAIFGPVIGIIAAAVSATLGSLTGFLTSRYIFSDWVDDKFPKKSESLNDVMEKHSWMTVMLLRVTPALPVGLTNLLMGVTKVDLGIFAIATLVGVVPWIAFYVIAGMELSSIEKASEIISTEIMLLALALIALIVMGRVLAGKLNIDSKDTK